MTIKAGTVLLFPNGDSYETTVDIEWCSAVTHSIESLKPLGDAPPIYPANNFLSLQAAAVLSAKLDEIG